MCKIKAI